MRINAPDREEQLADFEAEYQVAWLASGQPDEIGALEILLAALGEEQPTPELHALWVFFRCCLAKNLPLNWVHEYHPESVAGITRAISFMRTRITSLDLTDQA